MYWNSDPKPIKKPKKPRKAINKTSAKRKQEKFCPVCYGTGKRKDKKTKKIRPCVMCKGTGDWK